MTEAWSRNLRSPKGTLDLFNGLSRGRSVFIGKISLFRLYVYIYLSILGDLVTEVHRRQTLFPRKVLPYAGDNVIAIFLHGT